MTPRGRAIAKGATRYFTGKPCKHGHVAERLVSDCGCLECAKIKGKRARHTTRRAYHRRKVREATRRRRERLRAIGIKFYTAKAPCANGHARPKRLVSNDACYECHKAKYRSKYAVDPRYKRRSKEWDAANPERTRTRRGVGGAKRRARVKNAPGRHTAADIEHLLKKQKNRCAIRRCRADFALTGYHVDHVVALARGGSNDPSNLQALCPTCNMSKGSR